MSGELLVETYCTLCDVREVWDVEVLTTGFSFTPTIASRGRGPFVCEHWEDHHDASYRALGSRRKFRSATVPPVDAVVLTDRRPRDRDQDIRARRSGRAPR